MMQTASDDEEEKVAEGLVDVSVVVNTGGEETENQQNSAAEDAAADDSSAALATTTAAAVSTTTTATSNNTLTATTTTTTTHFPCIEQPQRITLHNCGYYLWSYRNGKAVARRKRSSNDEFLLEYVLGQNIVKITNHKFGGVLSAIEDENKNPGNGDRKICFIKPPKSTEKEAKKDDQKKKKSDSELKKKESNGGEDEDDEEEGFQDEPNHQSQQQKIINPEDQQWFFVKGNHNRIHLKSLATGQNLAIQKDSGNLTLVTDSIMKLHPYDKLYSKQSNITTSWDIECVTGELCFMSNFVLDTRIRCDMAGLLTTTTTTKGWEVFRFMEASHGYVKISSWMHKQWLLCVQADGTVTTCSHADSFLEDDDLDLDIEIIEKQEEEEKKKSEQHEEGNEFAKQKKKKKKTKCSKWAIMKYIPPTSSENGSNNETTATTNNNSGGGDAGVIIRNKTFGRLLCIKDGCILHTIDPNDPNDEKMNLEKQLKEAGYYDDDDDEDEDEDDSKIEAPSDRSGSASSAATANNNNNNLNKWWNNSTKSINTSMRKGMDNFSENSKNMSTSMRKNMNQWSKSWNKSMNTIMIASANGTELLPKQEEEQQQEAPPPPPMETIVWHIEAAHSQTYYFLNAPLSSSSSTTTTTTTDDQNNNNNNQEESKHDNESKEEEEEEESKKDDPETAATEATIAPKSIGPYPNVTPNLRQTEKIQLIRKKDGTTKLNLIEKNQYISCTANGQIILFDNNVFDTTSSSARTAGGQNIIDDESTDWIMDKHPKFPESGSTFRSKLYGYYLSYKAIEEEDEGGLTESAATAGRGADEGGNHDAEETEAATEKADSSKEEQQASTTSMNNSMMNLMLGKSSSSLGSSSRRNNKKSSEDGDNNNTLNNSMAMMNSMFGQKKEPIPTLVGVELVDELCVWNLQPCMPRAVSSEKIKTFALGTGIAVGTTIAMPFALAGVGAVLGAVGAEVGIVANAIAVGLTGAEALASVGAIGATAYIVFRPEENSLTDAPKVDDDDEDAKAEVEWSKRPLSNWREW